MASDATPRGREDRARDEEVRNRPVYTRWFTGNVFLRVWKNEGERGPYYNLTVVKKWKKADAAKNDSWQETDSFTENESLVAAEAFRHGWSWVESQKEVEPEATVTVTVHRSVLTFASVVC